MFLVNSWKNKDMIKIIDAFRTLVSIRFLLRQDLETTRQTLKMFNLFRLL